MRTVLVRALKRLFGDPAVTVEPRLGPGLKEPDLTLNTEAGMIILDTAVVNPTAGKHLAMGSHEVALAAATSGENTKRAQYQGTLARLALQPAALVPFVVESTGRLGSCAQAFLESLATMPGLRPRVDVAETLRFLVLEITVRIMRGNALSMARSREQARVIQAA